MTSATAELIAKAISRTTLPAPAERRAIRERARVSQAELAEAIGVTRQAIDHWERGDRFPTGANLERYAEALTALAQIVPT